ncbi:ArnT family glycosyltransferase [Paraburkholderia adhaesiva]|uniref:ArnT family glycosyltransferase n=1 Tax=Paraburkholderia adhaesiva TaxID=2883244 RepID=UPI001F3586EB|nr:glycosyltransferase family 39 protein [Paraburkholderia adhaesiva]
MKTQRRLGLGILAAILVSLAYIHASNNTGRLAHDITYDDIGYVDDATDRLALLFNHGALAFLRDLLTNPPHSPFSTVLAVIAILVGGYHDVVFYIANFLIIISAVVFLILEFKDTRPAALAWIVVTFLSSPLAYNTIENFRPDYALGFSTAAMAWWFIIGTFRERREYFKLSGIAFAAALLIKPTFFPHTLALAVSLMGLFTVVQFWRKYCNNEGATTQWRPLAVFSGIACLIALPYYLIAGHDIFNYFWTNTRGKDSYLWSFPETITWLEVGKEYLVGGYQHAIGFHLILAGLLLVFGIVYFTLRKMYVNLAITCSLAGFATLSFLILLVGRHKNDFFFATFQVTFLLAGIYCLAELCSSFNAKKRAVLLVASWIALGAAIHKNLAHGHPPTLSEDQIHNSWNDRVVTLIANSLENTGRGTYSNPVMVLVTVPGPVNAYTIKWLALKQGIVTRASDLDRSQTLSDFIAGARNSDFVVIPNVHEAEYYRGFPADAMQPELIRSLRQDPRFVALGPRDDSAVHYVVFKNVELVGTGTPVLDLHDVSSLDGFNPEEGPYPQWNLPRVQWMSAPSAKLCVKEPGHYSAEIRVRADSDGVLNIVDSHAGSQAVGRFEPRMFVDMAFAHYFSQDDLCILLKPVLTTPPAPENVLLFSRFRFTSTRDSTQLAK